jgi:hypothetical protein
VAYIGNNIQNQGFSPAVDYYNGDGTTVTFTLSRPVASVAQLTAVIENVIQNPSTAFSVAGNQITFTSAPPAGTNNIWVEYTSLVTTYAAISQDPSVIGDITATGGYLAEGDFGNSFIDGTIVDYVTGNARITTGPNDGLTIYNGGTSSRTAMGTFDTSGNFTNNATGYTKVATGTTAQRPGTPSFGMIRANTTTGVPEWYDPAVGVWKGFNVGVTYSIQYLVVAGGGGGGSSDGAAYYGGGGGGAGGYIADSQQAESGDVFTITVGSGGGGGSGGNRGTAGSNSSAFNQTAIGGGGGGGWSTASGGTGGSGGGARSGGSGAAGTSGQGNRGGNATETGAGGGGFSAQGVDNTSTTNGSAGGAGGNWQSLGTFYAGGGGGGSYSGGSPGAGGSGGGGNGGASGTANTGGGGGGGNSGNVGSSGGSGVVIIRYLGAQRGTGGTVTSSGGYTYHTFTTSGTYTA